MKVGGNRPATGAYQTTGTYGPRGTVTAPAAGASAVRPADQTAILGIPEAEFTPRVRDAIMGLMAEVDRLRQDLDRTKKRLDEVESLADRDSLTPLLNRRAFVREMSRVQAMTERYNDPASLIYIDLDGLKEVNDRLGHAAGDALILHFAKTLLAHVRESDIVGRLGGDEFGIILSRATEPAALKKAEQLAAVLQQSPAEHEGQRIPLSFAFGAYGFKQGQSPHDAIAAADKAMYAHKKAKKSGG